MTCCLTTFCATLKWNILIKAPEGGNNKFNFFAFAAVVKI